MTKQQFINWFSAKIDKVGIPVLKSLAIAQACLESAYGKKHFNNNYFGIKCHNPNAYAGCKLAGTKEYIDGSYKDYRLAFQVYNNVEESIADYARLMNIGRYREVRLAKNYIVATQAIRDCGYATSPSYVTSLRRIIEQYKLYELDKMTDIQLTKNFRLSEFGNVPQKYIANIKEVATELQKVRDILGRPIIITSGYRSPEYNRRIGGASNSMHLYGLASDSHMRGVHLHEYLAYLIRYTEFTGIGIGNPNKRGANLIHSDLRQKKGKPFAVWVY